ncbi:MAG: leucyl aminopeptidase [Glaciecola sp.]|jgi:leucyl aminopeptidase|nr:leucyl aminopeptidase [Glaciecola sp.]MDG1816404.1 leucyl aminopeptidase [Glaciecola sp.]MDG2098481.1 leucyl aminopeptidase [Glaciecola sp.]
MKILPHQCYQPVIDSSELLTSNTHLIMLVSETSLKHALSVFESPTRMHIQKVIDTFSASFNKGELISIYCPIGTELLSLTLLCLPEVLPEERLFNLIKGVTKGLNIQASSTVRLADMVKHDTSITFCLLTHFIQSFYEFDVFKTAKPDFSVPQIEFYSANETMVCLDELNALNHGMWLTKDLANLPANICTPAYLAEHSRLLSEKFDTITTDIFNAEAIEALGMGAYTAVGRGSNNPAHMSVIHYQGGGGKPIVLIGKGVTFDAGGITLKKALGMGHMTYDMCGAATIVGIIQIIAQLQLNINIIGVVAAVENLPDGDAYRPGDILTTLSGQTVEIMSTDAEGRLVIADVMTFAQRFTPRAIIDIATLTGAAIQSLGHVGSFMVSNHDDLAQQLLNASEVSFDRTWQMPLWDEYQEAIDSPFADMMNAGVNSPGAISAGCFLSRYTNDVPWIHLDVAGTAFMHGTGNSATGRPLPLLLQYLKMSSKLGT